MKLRDVISLLEAAAPLSLQESWDNSGLQVGDPEQEIRRALLCTDVTEATLQEALQNDCQLIISHHPLLFHGLKHLTPGTYVERCVMLAIQHGLAIYSGHTSFDNWKDGVNARIAQHIGLQDAHILVPQKANPEAGLGYIGELPEAMPEDAFLQLLKERFTVSDIRHTAFVGRPVKRVALCGGAGSEFVSEAIAQGADAYVSADFRHHEFFTAEGRILLADIGHFESEQYTKEIFRELLTPTLGVENLLLAKTDQSPIHHF